jgi:hypothetical protein
MDEGENGEAMRERRMVEPGAAEAYDAASLAFGLGRVRRRRVRLLVAQEGHGGAVVGAGPEQGVQVGR